MREGHQDSFVLSGATRASATVRHLSRSLSGAHAPAVSPEDDLTAMSKEVVRNAIAGGKNSAGKHSPPQGSTTGRSRARNCSKCFWGDL